jgi:hypothetical protein
MEEITHMTNQDTNTPAKIAPVSKHNESYFKDITIHYPNLSLTQESHTSKSAPHQSKSPQKITKWTVQRESINPQKEPVQLETRSLPQIDPNRIMRIILQNPQFSVQI